MKIATCTPNLTFLEIDNTNSKNLKIYDIPINLTFFLIMYSLLLEMPIPLNNLSAQILNIKLLKPSSALAVNVLCFTSGKYEETRDIKMTFIV